MIGCLNTMVPFPETMTVNENGSIWKVKAFRKDKPGNN